MAQASPHAKKYLAIVEDCRARRGEHVARNGRACTKFEELAAVVWQEFAACCHTDVGSGIDEAEDGHGTQDVFLGQ